MKKILSGVKPTGNLTLGNYLGAIKQFINYQEDSNNKNYIFIADLHSLTLPIEPEVLNKNIITLAATYLACGLNPEKTTLFRQSAILEHSTLEWILTCNTVLGELTKMPQYKNFLENHKNEPIPVGILLYPSLMNSDILLYDADYVPVGIDQKPHVDLTRDVAEKFNKRYGQIFNLPQALISSDTAKIMSLSDPTKKMSKSESDKGTIYLSDDRDTVFNKIMKAKTDSEGIIRYDPINKPGISNLLVIYAGIKDISIKAAEQNFSNLTDYGAFKREIANAVSDTLADIQEKVAEYKKDLNKIYNILIDGEAKARDIAQNKISQVYKAIGLK